MIKNNILSIISIIVLNFSLSQTCDGDSNNDFIVNVLDIITAVTHVLEEDLISGIAFDNTDLNNDGSVDILDVIAITSLILNGANTCEDLDIPLDLSLDWEIQEDVSYFNYESLENTLDELSYLSSFYGMIILHNGKIVG